MKLDLDEALRRFKLAAEAESEQRKNELEDLSFRGPDQWTEEAKRERGGTSGGVKTPPRPMLAIDLVQQPLELVYNQANKAELSVDFNPVSENSDEELVEVKKDLYRSIERDGAQSARMWAFDRASRCGRGYYRIVVKDDEDTDDPFDLKIAYERILHQECVYFDPAAKEPDFSDAEYCFVVVWKTHDQVKREFPNSDIAKTGSIDWGGFATRAPEWANRSIGGGGAIQIAEYWFKTYSTETWCRLKDGSVVLKGQGIEYPKDQIEDERRRRVTTLHVAKMAGLEELEEPFEWYDKLIPIVPVIGREQQPVNGKRLWEGMVRPAMDGQRFANFAASSMVEAMSLEPKAPWIIAEGQIEGYEDMWAQANLRNFSALPYKPVALGDKLAPPPQRAQVDSSKMQLSMMAWGEAKGFVQQTTAVHAYALGEQGTAGDPQSGKAILALQQQSDAGTSRYLDNFGKITIPYDGKVVLGLMPHIYDRPGRIAHLTGDEDKRRTVMLNAPFTMGPNKFPKRVQVPEGAALPDGAKHYDLSKGRESVVVDVGRGYQTRLQEATDMIGQVLAKAPQLMPLIGPTYFAKQDWPGAKEVAEILEKVRDQQFPFLGEDDDGQMSPQALKAQIAGLQQQGQAMQQQMQQMGMALQVDQAKQQAQMAKIEADATMKRLEIGSKERIAAADNETKLAIEGMANRFRALEEVLARMEDREARHEEMAHERAMAAAGGRSLKVSRERGSEEGSEEGREVSDGMADERSEQDQPRAEA